MLSAAFLGRKSLISFVQYILRPQLVDRLRQAKSHVEQLATLTYPISQHLPCVFEAF